MKGTRAGVETAKAKHKRMRPADHPDNRDLRRRRDLVWLYLASMGMSSREIERACAFANRSAEQIRKRLIACKKHQGKRHGGLPG